MNAPLPSAAERRIDLRETPEQKADRRRDLEMANTLALQAFKASGKRFSGCAITDFGGLL